MTAKKRPSLFGSRAVAVLTLLSCGAGASGSFACSSDENVPDAAAGSAGSHAGSGASSGTAGTSSGGSAAADGYAEIPDLDFPSLFRRVEAVACEGGTSAPCANDDDCGTGQACVCHQHLPRCLPARCRTDADCTVGVCILSFAPDADCCASDFVEGLYCGSPEDACAAGNGCPGNGAACVYVPGTQLFECRVTTCSGC